MNLFKETRPARKIDNYRSFAAEIKTAHIAIVDGIVTVTEMQTNSNALDCRWTTDSKREAWEILMNAGYTPYDPTHPIVTGVH